MKRVFLSNFKEVVSGIEEKFLKSHVLNKKEDLSSFTKVFWASINGKESSILSSGRVFYAKRMKNTELLLIFKYTVSGTNKSINVDLSSSKYRDKTFSIPTEAKEIEVYCLSKAREDIAVEILISPTQPIYSVSPRMLFGNQGHKIKILPLEKRKAKERTLNQALRLGCVRWNEEVSKELLVNITIDVEDKDFPDGCLIQDDLGRWPGVLEAAYKMKSLGVSGTFFVNVYEAMERSLEGKLRKICLELVTLGHEVGLHTHPSNHLIWYNKELPSYSLKEQRNILKKGKDALEKWTGIEVKSFRAGGYRYNKDTIKAVEAVGLSVDSSFLYGFVEQPLELANYILPNKIGEVYEAPITPIIISGKDEVLRIKKADLNWLNEDEHLQLVEDFTQRGGGYLNYMLHSFSFCDRRQIGKWGDGKKELSLLKDSMAHNNKREGRRRIVVFGEKKKEFDKFVDFLLTLKSAGANFKTVGEAMDDFEELFPEEKVPNDSIPLLLS